MKIYLNPATSDMLGLDWHNEPGKSTICHSDPLKRLLADTDVADLPNGDLRLTATGMPGWWIVN